MATMTKERKAKRSGIAWRAGNLKAALTAVRDAVPGRAAKPILSNVLFRDGLLTATDLELQIETAWPCEESQTMLMPFQRLAVIVGLCRPDDEVTLTPGDTSCIVTVGNGKWTIPTEDSREFPTMDAPGVTPVVGLPADQFARAVRSCVYATDNESSRYALGAVLIEVREGVATFVATDGRRLSRVDCDHDQAVDERHGDKGAPHPGVLVPRRAILTIARLAEAAGDQASVQLEASPTAITAEIGGTTVTARLVEGRFPRWRDVFPERDAKASVIDRGELLAATRAAAIVTTEESKGIDYAFTAEGLWLHGQSSTSGEASVTCPLVEFGQKVKTKVDPQFVVDFLQGLPSDAEPNVEIEAVDDQSAVVLRCGDCHGVIMPMARDV